MEKAMIAITAVYFAISPAKPQLGVSDGFEG